MAKKNPDMVEELAMSMAKAMAASGASGDDIVKAMQEALSATGASKEEIAHTLLAAMASSRASPDVIAKTMMMALQDSGEPLSIFFYNFTSNTVSPWNTSYIQMDTKSILGPI